MLWQPWPQPGTGDCRYAGAAGLPRIFVVRPCSLLASLVLPRFAVRHPPRRQYRPDPDPWPIPLSCPRPLAVDKRSPAAYILAGVCRINQTTDVFACGLAVIQEFINQRCNRAVDGNIFEFGPGATDAALIGYRPSGGTSRTALRVKRNSRCGNCSCWLRSWIQACRRISKRRVCAGAVHRGAPSTSWAMIG